MKTKSNSTAATAAFATAAALVTAASVAKIDPPLDTSKAEIIAPATVEAGELAIFHAQGSDVNWDIYPEIPLQEFSEQNSSLATSFQIPGEYLVICSYLDSNGRVQLRKHPVDVTPLLPKPPPVDDVVIVPPPVDDIVIEPIPDPTPNTKFGEAADKVKEICQETDFDKAKAAQLSDNFEDIAAMSHDSVASMLRETAKVNREVTSVNETTTQIQLLISRHRFDGELRTVADHADLWNQISRGLREYASE